MRINGYTRKISIFNKIPSFKFPHRIARKLITEIIEYYQLKIESINIIFLDNPSIKLLNKKHLKHNYSTDVISFRLNEGDIVEGEIYIGVDIARENAKKYNVKFYNEIQRLIIHGTLHLLGFDDSTQEERLKMSRMEDQFLILYNSHD